MILRKPSTYIIAGVCSVAIVATSLLSSCSGSSGGGGGGTGGGGSGSVSLIQASKMTCNGLKCIGSGSISPMSAGDVSASAITDAGIIYDNFNSTLIPALNSVINIIEQGASNAGAESCDDISLGFTGTSTANSILYNVKTQTSVLTAPALFTTTSMQKRLQGQVQSNSYNTIDADIVCGDGTNINPLVGRVLGDDGTNKLNAWYEKGTATHVRILMVVKYSGTVYAAWFKTDDGDNYEIVLASDGDYYKGVGSKSLGSLNYSENGVGDSCVNSTTGAVAVNCGGLSATSTITVTGIPDTLLNANTSWGSIGNSVVFVDPAY